jgi:Rsm1-like
MCQRRVGLWAFGPGASGEDDRPRRQFDLLKEHRPYCPYVVRSTIVPSLPMPSRYSAVLNGAVTSTGTPLSGAPSGQDAPVEGWRAILSIVLKCRKRSIVTRGGNFGAPTGSSISLPPEDVEVDRVEALVDGVKKRGVCVSIFIILNDLINHLPGKGITEVC